MHILPIARMGNPILQQIAKPIDLRTELDYAKGAVADMTTTLESFPGERVGLAAPQVHISKRIVIFRIPKGKANPRYTIDIEAIPLTALINPIITPVGEEMFVDWEPCISVPGLMGQVPRFRHITYSYYDLAGQFHENSAQGFLARLLQHECDHLDGILFPHRMKDFSTLGFEDEILKRK